mmetsp:Transcript_26583/g.35559  ORF Transcript_26583/g.35559 Transcript_26583/m.35559 type:complete len:139 (+) Transcript_26583:681-1097(+)|eukprot:CAMPEP_0185589712 /NCGR_PEP_ID=MMETSP0434-20130131/58104_1 /TAXON_ID=626734 ORGANISM="Favella taraikaensis, Strain Fe Narragansett Bay" /NCGR_SAMPLE_ID=MMETSP0434 /ASSEMBLY_ACC=CAM_ASM_000379 /LENGTH=138 /DNA_ID=CAMNT_0028213359 /DNA_START=677 /DNA_END=1093 /DNA_ORIENTATION=+
MISSVSLMASHLTVFAHVKLTPLIDSVKTDTIARGFNNFVGNKGAVKLDFMLAGRRFIIVNAHFHSGQDAVEKRNADFAAMLDRFVYEKTESGIVAPVSHMPDALIVVGDLNYRINGFQESILKAMSNDQYDLLLSKD